MRRRLALIAALILAAVLISGPAFAQSAAGVAFDARTGVILLGSPAGAANCKAASTGAIRYNSATPRIEFCDGTAWQLLVQTQTGGVTAPAGSGYFVLSYGTYDGNLGGYTGADAKCLTDLTTHTGWQGYAAANSNGQLVASKVHAFLCNDQGYPYGNECINLMPLTTYYFANALNSSAGGASFTTDGSAVGPGDANSWAAANYFSGTYIYWTGFRSYSDGTHWDTASYGNGYSCWGSAPWTSNSNGLDDYAGDSTATNRWRWGAGYFKGCDQTEHLICFVNP